jgi:hypothetical protein
MLAISAKVSKDARLSSIVTLVKSLSPKFIKRDQFFLDCSKIMPILAQSILSKLNELNPQKQLYQILEGMAYHQIGNRMFYELLAIEFVRNLDLFSLS